MLLATLGYAIGPLIIQRHLRELDSIGPLAASLLLPPDSRDTRLAHPAAIHALAHGHLSIAVLGVICTAVAMLLMFYLVGHAGAARASVITYINPAVATLLGVWLLHERLGIGGSLAFTLILIGSWLSTRGPAAELESAGRGARLSGLSTTLPGEFSMARQLISSGSQFERDIGYSRAVVDGEWVFVSGTTGFNYDTMSISAEPAGTGRAMSEEHFSPHCRRRAQTSRTSCGCCTSCRMQARFADCWPVLRALFWCGASRRDDDLRQGSPTPHADRNPGDRAQARPTAGPWQRPMRASIG